MALMGQGSPTAVIAFRQAPEVDSHRASRELRQRSSEDRGQASLVRGRTADARGGVTRKRGARALLNELARGADRRIEPGAEDDGEPHACS